jgi:transcriptional regulator with XRE-family HTH domain
MGRPSFQLDRELLRELRNKKKLTQADLARELCERLGLDQDEDTRTASYRRIEARGSTSRKRAEAIAKILGVTTEYLEGIVPPDTRSYEKRIRDLLAEQLRQENLALKNALDEACREGADSEDDALASMARNVARRIEAVQLARNPDELAELSQLTGLSEGELLEPTHVDGHWLVVASGQVCTRTELVLGPAGVMSLIPEIVGTLLDDFGSDGRIQMRRALPWYRLEIDPLCGRFTTWIDFVRCIPTDNGLRWLKPSRSDTWFLEGSLINWARSTANFVTGFDEASTPDDVRRLRFRLTEYNGKPDARVSEKLVAGCLEAITEEQLGWYQRESNSHSAAILMLGNALREILEPHLSSHPHRCWEVLETGDGCAIYLWPTAVMAGIPHGLRYQVQLVEETMPGQLRPVPWRYKDRADLKQRIETWLS